MPQNDINYDTASALIVGGRDHQEDAIIADFPVGSDIGVVVLSDGMGGHAAGDVASKIMMTEMFCELKFQSGDEDKLIAEAPTILRNAVTSANECLRAHIEQNPELRGMGATLLTLVMRGDELRWLSVGDSPLYLFRGTELRQLNEDHSMAPRIDAMVAEGILTEVQGREHPDRNALLSVCSGDPIQKIDCKDAPFTLEHGDIVIAASDGLQYLELDVITDTLKSNRGETSARIARALLDEIDTLGDPEQDNTSMAIIKVVSAAASAGVEDAVRSAFSIFSEDDDEDDDDPAEAIGAVNDEGEATVEAEAEAEPAAEVAEEEVAAEEVAEEEVTEEAVSEPAPAAEEVVAEEPAAAEAAEDAPAEAAEAPEEAEAETAEADAEEKAEAAETDAPETTADAAEAPAADDAPEAAATAEAPVAEAAAEAAAPTPAEEPATAEPKAAAAEVAEEAPGPEAAPKAEAAPEAAEKTDGEKAETETGEEAKDDTPPAPKVETPSEDVIIAFVAEQMRAAAAEAEAEAKAKAEAEARGEVAAEPVEEDDDEEYEYVYEYIEVDEDDDQEVGNEIVSETKEAEKEKAV